MDKCQVQENKQEGGSNSVTMNEYYEDTANSGCGCGCFGRLFCFGKNNLEGGECRSLLQENGEQPHQETWLVNKLKKLKEFSELLAGPKWKNFIRKMGKYGKSSSSSSSKKKSKTQFQYDPQSYALNFDHGEDEDDDDGLLLNFPSRFAPPHSAELPRPAAAL